MFNFITVDFPTIDNKFKPSRVTSFIMRGSRYEHEMAVVNFRDWDVNYDVIKPGTPVDCTIRSTDTARRFIGYVSHITPKYSPGKRFVEVALIGASYVLKQADQGIYYNKTASDIVKDIAKKFKFSYSVYPHQRVFPQFAQTGHTYFEMLNRLASQSGYSFFIKNTTIYFRPITHQFTYAKAHARKFIMRDATDPLGSTLYSFNLTAGETVNYADIMKAAFSVQGVTDNSKEVFAKVNAKQPTLKTKFQYEFFDRYATNTVAPSDYVAEFEAKALDDRTRFPYRATAIVDGTPNIYPDDPIYLDGLGKDYSGYWIVLGVNHVIKEDSLNRLKYTTMLELGADSLGELNMRNRVLPTKSNKRLIVAGVTNKVQKGSPYLYTGVSTGTPKSAPTFNDLKNRKAGLVSGKTTKSPKWVDNKTDVSSGTWLT